MRDIERDGTQMVNIVNCSCCFLERNMDGECRFEYHFGSFIERNDSLFLIPRRFAIMEQLRFVLRGSR